MRRFRLLLLLVLSIPAFFALTLAQSKDAEKTSKGQYLYGFESIGLTEKATPIEVCKALPVGAIWSAYIQKSRHSAWSGYHNFTGTVMAVKVTEEKCLLYRVEDNYGESGWEKKLSSSTMYMAQYTNNSESPTGYDFTGFEPLNGKSQSKVRNDGVAAMELVKTCESYEGTIWQYDSKQHLGISHNIAKGQLVDVNGFFTQDNTTYYQKSYRNGIYNQKNYPVIDCQTLIKMALAGIPYEYSQYADSSYQFRQLNAYPWSMQTPNVWLYELMEWCISSGYEVAPGDNFEHLQAGDLIFFGSVGEARNAQVRKVSHVAMFTGRWVADKGYTPVGASGKTYKKIYSFPIYDKNGKFVGNDTTTLHPQTIEVFQAPDKLPNTCVVRHGFLDSRTKTSHRRENIVMYARLPLNTNGCWNNRNPWDNPANMIHVSGLDTEYRIDITGDGHPVALYIGSLNQVGIMKQSGKNISTDYMPYGESCYEHLPAGAKLVKCEWFDALLKPLSKAEEAVFVKRTFAGVSLEKMQSEYMYNAVNQYKVMNASERPILVTGVLKKGEQAVIDTKTGRVFTSEGSVLTLHQGAESEPGMKVVYCPTGQEAMVTWNN